MSGQVGPPFRRRRLGHRLRGLRERAGLTLDEAAEQLDKKRTSLHRVETGETRADVHLVRSMMDLYDAYEDGLLDATREAYKPGWWRAFGLKDFGYVDVETEASGLMEFNALNIPGLMQHEPYSRALLQTGTRRTEQELENMLAVRAIRQKRLTAKDKPLELAAIIDEAALHREVGGSEVMLEQLRHLVQLSAYPTVAFQVMPFRSGAHDAMSSSFIVLEFPGQDEADLFYVEYTTGAIHIEDEEQVVAARLVFDRLRSQALSPEDSVELVNRVARERYGGS
ncbi:helix-turn-helix domain-containing protein [Amycolatopsis samaneae]|uniref:Helix-turn-helix domain-containing protein n=1 Tax=Amycolatopsis samaneae TaxID=664691 RepID=A0ABW5GEU4_9PSEU